jgi:hypothetical protein
MGLIEGETCLDWGVEKGFLLEGIEISWGGGGGGGDV